MGNGDGRTSGAVCSIQRRGERGEEEIVVSRADVGVWEGVWKEDGREFSWR